jgi:hypothetical protein
MKLITAGLVAFITASSAWLVAQAGPRRDGNWDVTVEMQMPNMPNMPAGMSMPPMKMTQCITKEEAADPSKAMPQRPPQRGGGPAGDCKVSDYKTEGPKVSWSMVCTGAQPMTGTGEFTYAADSYTGNMTMNMARGGQPMMVTMKYTGKRLGDCVK